MSARESPRRGSGSVERLLLGIAQGHSIETAARDAGMSEATAHRRLADPDVRTELDSIRRRFVAQATDRLARLAVEASVVLGQIMADTTVPPSTRVSAARAILDKSLTWTETAALEARLTELEAAHARMTQRRFA